MLRLRCSLGTFMAFGRRYLRKLAVCFDGKIGGGYIPDLHTRFARSKGTGRKYAGSSALTSVHMCEMSKMSLPNVRQEGKTVETMQT
jgi:hypothetical protein